MPVFEIPLVRLYFMISKQEVFHMKTSGLISVKLLSSFVNPSYTMTIFVRQTNCVQITDYRYARRGVARYRVTTPCNRLQRRVAAIIFEHV